MRIDWFQFSAALLLLLTPIGLFHGRRVRFRPLQRQWGDEHWGQVFRFGLHAIDLLRAVLGTWLLLEAVTRVPEARGILRHGVLLSHAAVLWLGVLLQAMVCKEPDSIHAPFTFVTGIVAVYFYPAIAGFALVLAVMVPMATRIAASFFPSLALLLVAIGYLLSGQAKILELAIAGMAAFLPFLLSLLLNRQFVIAYRPRRNSGTASPLKPSPLR